MNAFYEINIYSTVLGKYFHMSIKAIGGLEVIFLDLSS